MRRDETLTAYEGFALLCLSFLHLIFTEAIPEISSAAGTSAWISQCAGLAFGFVFLLLALLLYRMYPGQELLQIFESVYGRWLSKLAQLAVLALLLCGCAVLLDRSVKLLQTFAYSEIPAPEIQLLVILGAVIIAVYSVGGLGKTMSLFLPVAAATLLLILGLSWRQYDYKLLRPVWGYGVPQTLWAGIGLETQYIGVLTLGIFMSAFQSRRVFARSAALALLAAGTLVVFCTICYGMTVPYTSAGDLLSGILGIVRNNRNSRFVQQLESIYIAVAVISVVLLAGLGLLCAKKTWCTLFRIRKAHSGAVILPLAALCFCAARLMPAIPQVGTELRRLVWYRGGAFLLALLLSTLLLGGLRKAGSRPARRAAALLIPLLIASTLSGCGNYREPDSLVYPIAMGYDRGESERYRLTLRFMQDGKDPKQEPKDDVDGGDPPGDTLIAEAPSFTMALDRIGDILPKQISLTHVKMIAVSEELARDGLDSLIGPMIRYSELKPTIALVVCRESAYDFLMSEHPAMTPSIQQDMELILTNTHTTDYQVVSIADFLYRCKSTYGDALAMYGAVSQSKYPGNSKKEDEPRANQIGGTRRDSDAGYLPGELPVAGENRMELAGMAVFRGGSMVGSLDTAECQTAMFLTDNLRTGNLALPDPRAPASYHVTVKLEQFLPVRASCRVDDDGTAHIGLDVSLSASVVLSQNPGADYIGDVAARDELAGYIARTLEQRSQTLISKLQSLYRADALQLGQHMAKLFPDIQSWEQYNWQEQFPQAQIAVSVSVKPA